MSPGWPRASDNVGSGAYELPISFAPAEVAHRAQKMGRLFALTAGRTAALILRAANTGFRSVGLISVRVEDFSVPKSVSLRMATRTCPDTTNKAPGEMENFPQGRVRVLRRKCARRY